MKEVLRARGPRARPGRAARAGRAERVGEEHAAPDHRRRPARETAGRVVVLGGSPSDRAVRRRVGFLSEESTFPPELSAPAALELCGALSGIGRRERRERAAALLERVELDGHGSTPLGRYSRGMLRRFGLAQAFPPSPRARPARRAHRGPRRGGLRRPRRALRRGPRPGDDADRLVARARGPLRALRSARGRRRRPHHDPRDARGARGGERAGRARARRRRTGRRSRRSKPRWPRAAGGSSARRTPRRGCCSTRSGASTAGRDDAAR